MNVAQIAQDRGWSEEELRHRKSICDLGKLCYDKNYIVGADGNLSVRQSDGTILITPAGAMKGFLSPHQIAKIDMSGEAVDDGPQASSEKGIHLVAYEKRPDVKAVVHCHPPHAVAMTVAGFDLQAPFIPEIVVTIGGIPTAPFGTPGTEELAQTIENIVTCSDTMVMKNHGSVTLGPNLMDAFKKLDMIEHSARILWLAQCVGHIQPLAQDKVDKLLATRKKLGVTVKNTLENRCGLDERP